MNYYAHYSSPIGSLTLTSTETALTGLWMESQKNFPSVLGLQSDGLPVLRQAECWLDRYFSGEKPDPAEIPVALTGTAFQNRVWHILMSIPYGSTLTYGQIAAQISPKMSAQAVGNTVGRNPVSIIIPCHRVLGSGGQLTGYAGGLHRKEWLLRHEGISFLR